MKRLLVLIMGFVAMLQLSVAAIACDLCAVYRSMEAKSSKQGFNLGVFEQYTHFDTLQLEGTKVDDSAGQVLDSSITQFIVGYQSNRNIGVQVNVPYINRSFRRADGAGGINKGTESGLGDLSLIGHYRASQRLTDNTVFVLDLIGGVKFPTGSTSRIKEELAEEESTPGAPESGIHGHDLALGSGSYDGIIGTAFFGSWQRIIVSGGLTYTIRTRGDYNYEFANDLHWNIKPGAYLWLTHANGLELHLAVSGEFKGKDNLAGVKALDTGMTSIFIGPGLNYTWHEHLNAEFGTEFPVVRNNTALQLVPDNRIKAALTWRF
jgi:opacity protein-like surface antigen